MSSLKYWVWLAAQTELRPSEKTALLHAYGDPEAAFFAPKGDLLHVEGLRETAAETLEKRDLTEANRILGACEEQNIRVLSLQDTLYPGRLKQIYAPPPVLYCKGRLRDLDEEAAIAVVGTRRATPYGLAQARALAGGIVRCGGTVLSGLGAGIDGEAAKAALEAGGYCVGVLGTSHQEAGGWLAGQVADFGLLISEYAPGTVSQRHFFRDRNRITAGLSVGVVVVEAPEKSGALLFAQEALELGREVFAVPGAVDAVNSVGTINMIKQGAAPVTCAWDVMEDFAPLFPGRIRHADDALPRKTLLERAQEKLPAEEKNAAAPVEAADRKNAVDSADRQDYIDWKEQLKALSEDQLKIISAIEKDATHIDDIVETTGLGAAKVLAQLTVLEIKGYIRREAGRRVALKITKK